MKISDLTLEQLSKPNWLKKDLVKQILSRHQTTDFSSGYLSRCAILRKTEARIATDLKPQIESHLTAGSTMKIVGYDGPNIAERTYPWKEYLAKWLKDGVSVEYLLLAPSSEAAKALLDLESQFPEAMASYSIDWKSCEEEEKACLEAWKTKHFVLIDNPKLLWLEGNHPAGKREAEDCWLLDCRDRGSLIHDEYRHRWDMAASRFVRLHQFTPQPEPAGLHKDSNAPAESAAAHATPADY